MDERADHIAPLTSLRFFAAISVVFFHAGSTYARESGVFPSFLVNMLGNGWLGVPFFFVLSGFILTHVYRNTGLTAARSPAFFLARFARIYPVYLLSLLLMLPFVPALTPRSDWQQFVMLQSWYPESNHWNVPGWTLSVEAFFYLLFPVLLPLLERLSVGRLLAGLAAVIAVLMVIWLRDIPGIGGSHRLLLLLRLPEFVYGMLLGALLPKARLLACPAVLYISIGLVLAAMASPHSHYSHTIAILAIGPLIFSAAGNNHDIVSNALRYRGLVFLGSASYAIYVLQTPVRAILDAAWPSGDMLARSIYIPVLIIVSCIVFAFFEEPARRALRRRLGRSAIQASQAA